MTEEEPKANTEEKAGLSETLPIEIRLTMTAEVALLRLLTKGRFASTGWQPTLEMVSLTTLTTSVESIVAVVILGPAAGLCAPESLRGALGGWLAAARTNRCRRA
jgi:hypothetical protein